MATSSATGGMTTSTIAPLFPRKSALSVKGPGWTVLRRARRSHGVSQTMFALITGLSVSAIGRIERGRIAQPRPRTVLLILGGLDMCGAVEAYRRAAS